MKRLGIGFTAIIALLAMSFTFASKTGALSKGLAKATITAGCYTAVQFKFPQGNPPVLITTIFTALDAPDYDGVAILPDSNEDFPVVINSDDNETLLTAPDGAVEVDPAECDPSEVFCCYLVQQITSGPNFGEFKIKAIYYGDRPL